MNMIERLIAILVNPPAAVQIVILYLVAWLGAFFFVQNYKRYQSTRLTPWQIRRVSLLAGAALVLLVGGVGWAMKPAHLAMHVVLNALSYHAAIEFLFGWTRGHKERFPGLYAAMRQRPEAPAGNGSDETRTRYF